MPLNNFTPHQMGFLIQTSTGERIINLPPSGKQCRVSISNTEVGKVDGIPVVYPEEGRVIGLPPLEPGVIIVASSMVAKIIKRPDVMSPDTTERGVVRDGSKQVIAVRNLQSFAPPAEVVAFLEEYEKLNTGAAPEIAVETKKE